MNCQLAKIGPLLLMLALGLGLTSCSEKCEETLTYIDYEPVYLSYGDLRAGVASQAPRSLENPGKIYFYEPYILINEVNEGIHVIDNSDKGNPLNVAFVPIPGNVDMAVKSNVLYADSYMDLVALDLSNPAGIAEVGRVEDVFAQNFAADPELGVITDWTEVQRSEVHECGGSMNYYYYDDFVVQAGSLEADAISSGVLNAPTAGGDRGGSQGVGGSMARFTIAGDYMYAVTLSDLMVFDIAAPQQPVQGSVQNIGWNIETIFPFGGQLLIGSQTGMFIYDIAGNPANPEAAGAFEHVRSCDPVVAEGEIAYVTLRSGTPCEGFANELDVLDISDISNPELLKVYPMANPHGLGIEAGYLFICEAGGGLKVYNAADPMAIDENQIAHFTDIHAYDVIPFGGTLFLIGNDGFYQYDYTDIANGNIALLSKIAVQ